MIAALLLAALPFVDAKDKDGKPLLSAQEAQRLQQMPAHTQQLIVDAA